MKHIRVPFDQKGNQLHFDNLGYRKDPISGKYIPTPPNYVDNYEFEDSLRIIDYDRGRSRVTIFWRSVKNDREYTSTMNNMFDIIKLKCERINGENVFTGKFCFCKRGTSYSLMVVENEESLVSDNND